MNEGCADWHTFQGIDWCVDDNDTVRIVPARKPESGYSVGELRDLGNVKPEWEKIVKPHTRIVFENGVFGRGDWSLAFAFSNQLLGIDLRGLDTSRVTNMNVMFGGCNALTSLDLSSFNTENVTDMGSMFALCQNLVVLDLTSFNTSNVTNMIGMFGSCNNLVSLVLRSFDTSNVRDMRGMFENCQSLTSLDIGLFDTSNVESMVVMLRSCFNLRSLVLPEDLSWEKLGQILDSCPNAPISNLLEVIRNNFCCGDSRQAKCAEHVIAMIDKGISLEDITGRNDWWNTKPVFDRRRGEWNWQ